MQTLHVLEKTFEAEANDIALYLAMSEKAKKEGHTEIAQYLFNIALEEAKHATEFAILLGKIKDTRTNLTTMLEDEIKSIKDREEALKIALSEGNEEVSVFFEKSIQDEKKHAIIIKKALSKIQEKD